jgi:methylase of polypeptide subunit release factors
MRAMENAKECLDNFLTKHSSSMADYTGVPIEETGLLEEFNQYPLKLTHFEDLYDTLIYSNLIAKALELRPHTELVIDLGAGSSIPSLLALKKSKKEKTRTLSVDIDPEAKEVGHANAEALGLEDRFSFHQGEMDLVLSGRLGWSPSLLVASNPPYIAAPSNVSDVHFVPIHGGDDGSRYMLDLLSAEYPKGTTLALLFGSLTNPCQMLPIIEKKFDIHHVEAVKIHFGKYTKRPEIYKHLQELRAEGRVVFETGPKGDTQIVIGAILEVR